MLCYPRASDIPDPLRHPFPHNVFDHPSNILLVPRFWPRAAVDECPIIPSLLFYISSFFTLAPGYAIAAVVIPSRMHRYNYNVTVVFTALFSSGNVVVQIKLDNKESTTSCRRCNRPAVS
jgi:hypothetical protein